MLPAAWAAYCLFGIGACGFWGRGVRYWPLWCRFMLPGWVSAVSFCSSALLLGGWAGGCLGIWVGGWMGLWVCMDSMGLCGWGWPCGYVPLNCMGLVVLATRIYHVYK